MSKNRGAGRALVTSLAVVGFVESLKSVELELTARLSVEEVIANAGVEALSGLEARVRAGLFTKNNPVPKAVTRAVTVNPLFMGFFINYREFGR